MIYGIEIKGEIKIGILPKVFNNTAGYRGSASPEQIYSDGFRPYVPPVLTEYQKEGDVYFDDINDVYTKRIVDMTPEEVTVVDQRKEANDLASEFFDNRIDFGRELTGLFSKFLYRKVTVDGVSKSQAVSAMSTFCDSLLPLHLGYLEESKSRLNALKGLGAQTEARDYLITRIDAYLNNE